MILCAGFGTRLEGLTKDCPKPMLPIGGKPLLEHSLVYLKQNGIDEFIINLHFLADKITSYFGSGKKWGIKIDYSFEESPLGTAGAVKNVEKYFALEKSFLVFYGDVFARSNLRDLLSEHHRHSYPAATIFLHERKNSNSNVEMNSAGLIEKFIERPTVSLFEKNQNWVNSGIYCFSPSIFDFIESKAVVDFPKDVFGKLLERKIFYGVPHKGYRCAVDSKERYEQLLNDYREKKCEPTF